MPVARLLVSLLAALSVALAATGPPSLLSSREEVALPEGRWSAPAPSPDGRFLAFSTENYRGLKLLDLGSGEVTTLSEARGAGFHARWSDDSASIAFRTSTGGPEPKLRIVVAHPDGATETATPLERSLSLPIWQGTSLTFVRFEGETPAPFRVGPEPAPEPPPPPVASPGGRLWLPSSRGEGFRIAPAPGGALFLPVPSPDGKTFVVECLDGRLYLGAPEGGELEDLGPGSYPSFVRGGEALLFERTEDDGHALVAADIFLMDLKTRGVRAVTLTGDRAERRPSMAGDGHTLYFEEDGRIVRGWVP